MVTWLPEMSAGVAVDVICAVFWPVSRRSGTRGVGRSLFVNFAGNRRALQARLLEPQVDLPLVRHARSCLVGQGTLGRRQLSSPSWRFFVVGLFCLTLTDPPGDSPGCGRDKVRNQTPWLSRVMPSRTQPLVSQFGDSWCLNPERLDVAILLLACFPRRCFRRLAWL